VKVITDIGAQRHCGHADIHGRRRNINAVIQSVKLVLRQSLLRENGKRTALRYANEAKAKAKAKVLRDVLAKAMSHYAKRRIIASGSSSSAKRALSRRFANFG
jgi:hypothetical protein